MISIRKVDPSEIPSLSKLISYQQKAKLSSVPSDFSIIKKGTQPSKVISIKNMFRPENLEDDFDFEQIEDMVYSECKKYGKIISAYIPRPQADITVPGLGKAFVEYATKEGATFAKESLETLDSSIKLQVLFHPEEMFKKGIFD